MIYIHIHIFLAKVNLGNITLYICYAAKSFRKKKPRKILQKPKSQIYY